MPYAGQIYDWCDMLAGPVGAGCNEIFLTCNFAALGIP